MPKRDRLPIQCNRCRKLKTGCHPVFCTDCMKPYKNSYYQRNRERILRDKKLQRDTNPNQKELDKEKYESHRKQRILNQKNYYERHKEKILEKAKIRYYKQKEEKKLRKCLINQKQSVLIQAVKTSLMVLSVRLIEPNNDWI